MHLDSFKLELRLMQSIRCLDTSSGGGSVQVTSRGSWNFLVRMKVSVIWVMIVKGVDHHGVNCENHILKMASLSKARALGKDYFTIVIFISLDPYLCNPWVVLGVEVH